MYHTFALADAVWLINVCKNILKHFEYSKHIQPQTKEHDGAHQAEFSEFGSWTGICSLSVHL